MERLLTLINKKNELLIKDEEYKCSEYEEEDDSSFKVKIMSSIEGVGPGFLKGGFHSGIANSV